MFTILIADDEERIRRLVSDFLRRDGYTVLQAADGGQAMELIDQKLGSIDLIILDVMMPVYDGWSVLRHIRSKNTEVPVMMLTARTEENDEVFGFDLGADDYISKPFGILELLSRIRAVARRTVESSKSAAVNGAHSYDYGNVHVDEDGHVVTVDGEEVLLTRKEFRLLCDLLRNQGRVLTRDQIMEQVWGFDYGGATRTVDIHINTLRKKIHDDGTMIQTVRGIGYKIDKEAKE